MPPVEIELEIPYNIQIAALLSLGLVYMRSANKHISYVLLKEIGRLPGNEIEKDLNSLDREAYSLTAGLALGLILLEKGKRSLTIMDSTFTDELYHYMVGGHKEKNFDSASGDKAGCADKGSFGAGGASGATGDNNFMNMNSNNARGGGNSAGAGASNTNNSYIREGESINTNVTCPGATLALGLIYFNSCDRLIAEWFAPPDSAYLLDSIRPDFLLLRTLARNLIMWKYILPTQTWLLGQLSPLLRAIVRGDRFLNEKLGDLVSVVEQPVSAPPPKPAATTATASSVSINIETFTK
jgi:anaphase-promoting complex subunit 1